jgi:hypothetical protein
MLEGFAREDIKLAAAQRLALPARRADEGRDRRHPLTEPHITLAEKKGCRIICSAFFHGTEWHRPGGCGTYAAFNRAVREAVRRITPTKRLPALFHRLSRQEIPRSRR